MITSMLREDIGTCTSYAAFRRRQKYQNYDLSVRDSYEEGKRAVLVVWQSKYALYRITACNMQLQHPEFKFSWDLCCMS